MSDTAATAATAGATSKAPYVPSMILAADALTYVSSYLQKELKDVLDGAERAAFVAKLDKWRRMAKEEPEEEQKTYPWLNASNIVTPIMAQKQNTIFAKLISMFSTKRPFWSCSSDDSAMTEHANAVASLMNFLASGVFQLNLNKINRTLFYDLALLGTQVVKVPWLYASWPISTPGATPGLKGKADRVQHNGPAVVPVRLEDFFIRSYYEDLQRAPWVATRSWLTHAELLQREADGIYANVAAIEDFYAKDIPEDRRKELERRGFSPESLGDFTETRLYPIYECYLYYDNDGDGIPEDIKVWFEAESGAILRAEDNILGVRDIAILRYFNVPYELFGLGIGHFIERLQEEADFLHNHRIDNLHFSLIPAYKRRRGSMGKKQQEIHPGAFIDVDDMNDIAPFITPDLTASTFQSEGLTRDYADRVSGANDPMSGYADPTMKSGADVGSTLFLAEQGNSILNAIYDGIENDYNEIGQLVLMQLVVNKDKVDLSMLTADEQTLVQEVLALPIETLPTTFSFRVETTDQSRSEETKRQTLAQASALYAQYGQEMMSLTAIIDNPQLPTSALTKQMAQRMFIGGTLFVKQAFAMMKVEHADEMLPDTTAMAAALAAETQGATGAEGGAGAGAGAVAGTGNGNGGGIPSGPQVLAREPGVLGVVPQGTGSLAPFGAGAGAGG
jgi:hypothetical protein